MNLNDPSELPAVKVGYARVSTSEQSTRLQRHALKQAGCETIFVDEDASGKNRNRPALKQALQSMEPGQTLMVWKLDRLARSLQDLLDISQELKANGVHLESLTEKLDTSSAYGEFTFHMIAAIAQMERRLISERTIAGLQSAKIRGKRLGRRPLLSTAQINDAYRDHGLGLYSKDEIAKKFGVSRPTLDRAFGKLRQSSRADN